MQHVASLQNVSPGVMMKINLKLGDFVTVLWDDGYSIECRFVMAQSGFYVFKDLSGNSVICRPQNVTIRKVQDKV